MGLNSVCVILSFSKKISGKLKDTAAFLRPSSSPVMFLTEQRQTSAGEHERSFHSKMFRWMDENSQRTVFRLVLPFLVFFDPAILGEARSIPCVGVSRGSDLCGRFLFRAKKKQQESPIFQTKDDISSDAL